MGKSVINRFIIGFMVHINIDQWETIKFIDHIVCCIGLLYCELCEDWIIIKSSCTNRYLRIILIYLQKKNLHLEKYLCWFFPQMLHLVPNSVLSIISFIFFTVHEWNKCNEKIYFLVLLWFQFKYEYFLIWL